MTTYVRKINNVAIDVTTNDPAHSFHPDLAIQFITVPDGTQNGATYALGVWTNPTPVPTPTPPVVWPLLTPMTVYLAFTVLERIAIKTSIDPLIKEFWATYNLSVQLDKPTDPNLISVQGILAYMVTAGILSSNARIAQISAGVPQ